MSLPPNEIPLGAMRFNSDSQKLEYWMGSAWMQIQTFSPNLDGGVRGFFVGGVNPSSGASDRIDFITISTQGNATDFGNLTGARSETAGFSNATRALAAGKPPNGDSIDVWTMSSTGNASDFGNLVSATNNAQGLGGLANATRGIFGGGYQIPSGGVNVLQFVTISSNGDTQDFGDLAGSPSAFSGATGGASPTRGIWFGGNYPSDNNIQYITIASTGNGQDFGEMSDVKSQANAAGNAVRMLYFQGQSLNNTIEFITTATLGNTTNFGDMTLDERYGATSNSSFTRACVGGGSYPASTQVIDYVQIMTQGNAVDFGDLSQSRYYLVRGCISNGHGGLG